MAKSVPFASAPRAAANPCGIVATFVWDGEYEAPCIRPAGHDERQHFDGITNSKLPSCATCGDELIPVPGTAEWRAEAGFPDWAHRDGDRDHEAQPEGAALAAGHDYPEHIARADDEIVARWPR